jgi:DNA-binding XRE family transcriptional regulator
MIVEKQIRDSKMWDDLDMPLENYDNLHFKIINSIINRRVELGLTQRDLAKISGVKQSAIARLENFKVVPKIYTLYKLMNPLGLKLITIEIEGH